MPITSDYAKLLFDMYVKNRMAPYWVWLWECHDEEDRGYFSMLDEEMDKGNIEVDP